MHIKLQSICTSCEAQKPIPIQKTILQWVENFCSISKTTDKTRMKKIVLVTRGIDDVCQTKN